MAGKATAEKTISLSNLSRFKGKCDEKYRLYFHTITISDNNNTRHVRFTVPSSSGDAVNTFLGLYLLLGEGKIYVSGNADGDSNLCADDLNIHAVKLTNGSRLKTLSAFFISVALDPTDPAARMEDALGFDFTPAVGITSPTISDTVREM